MVGELPLQRQQGAAFLQLSGRTVVAGQGRLLEVVRSAQLSSGLVGRQELWKQVCRYSNL